jgi:hypothetical protein
VRVALAVGAVVVLTVAAIGGWLLLRPSGHTAPTAGPAPATAQGDPVPGPNQARLMRISHLAAPPDRANLPRHRHVPSPKLSARTTATPPGPRRQPTPLSPKKLRYGRFSTISRAAHGYVCCCASLLLAFKGDVEAAHAGFAEATKIGDRFGDPQLIALGRVGEGRCLIYLGEIVEGMALLDEAMVAITAHEVSPAAVGDLYCTVIEGCQEVFDVRRAQEWTAALSRWCDSQPELVLYRGQCLVHRAELMLFGGAWADAVAEVRRACDRLARPTSQPALGAAHYVRAELHRLRVSSLRQRWRTGRRTNGDASHNLVWRSCGLLRVESMRPTPRCAGSSTRLRTS